MDIPLMVSEVADRIHEGLPDGKRQKWPTRFAGAIKPGSDLSLIGWKFLYWLLTKSKFGNFDNPLVRDAVKQCTDILKPLIKGVSVDKNAVDAAEAARPVAGSAWAITYFTDESASNIAEATGETAKAVAEYDETTTSAKAAAWATKATAEAVAATKPTWSAGNSAKAIAYEKMADKLIELIKDA